MIDGDGVWKIRKRERVPNIEVVKIEESGHGDIISREFSQWRTVDLPALQNEQSPDKEQHGTTLPI